MAPRRFLIHSPRLEPSHAPIQLVVKFGALVTLLSIMATPVLWIKLGAGQISPNLTSPQILRNLGPPRTSCARARLGTRYFLAQSAGGPHANIVKNGGCATTPNDARGRANALPVAELVVFEPCRPQLPADSTPDTRKFGRSLRVQHAPHSAERQMATTPLSVSHLIFLLGRENVAMVYFLCSQ